MSAARYFYLGKKEERILMFRFGGYTCHWENSGEHLHFQDTGRNSGVKEKEVKEKKKRTKKWESSK